jgi:hypothetical protein
MDMGKKSWRTESIDAAVEQIHITADKEDIICPF